MQSVHHSPTTQKKVWLLPRIPREEFGKRFPGFERETHGIEVDANGEYWMRAVIETPNDTGKRNDRGKQRRPEFGAAGQAA